MAASGGKRAEGHSLIQLHIISDVGGLTDYHAGSWSMKKYSPMVAPGLISIPVLPWAYSVIIRGIVGNIFQIQLMGNPVYIDGEQPRITEDHLFFALGRRGLRQNLPAHPSAKFLHFRKSAKKHFTDSAGPALPQSLPSPHPGREAPSSPVPQVCRIIQFSQNPT